MTYISSLYSHYFEILIINNNYFHKVDNSLMTGLMQYVYEMCNYNQIIFFRYAFLYMKAWRFNYEKMNAKYFIPLTFTLNYCSSLLNAFFIHNESKSGPI